MLGHVAQLAGSVVRLTPKRLHALWRKIGDRALVVGLHFHDARHEAITRPSKRLDVLSLARVVGNRDIRMLMRYYNLTALGSAMNLSPALDIIAYVSYTCST